MRAASHEGPPGRVAVVTGGAMGIGQEIALRLARDGLAVAVADIAPTDETEALVRAAGGRVFAAPCDVTSAADVARFAEGVKDAFGAPQIVVANAGIYPMVSFLETDWTTWRAVMSLNLDSLFHVFQAFLPAMIAARWGRLIGVTSGTFHFGTPLLSAYAASKGGVLGVVRSLASEVGEHGVTVNAIAPTLTPTPGTEGGRQRELGLFDMAKQVQAIKRTAEPGDPAGAVSFLVSADASFITGQTIAIDGGTLHL